MMDNSNDFATGYAVGRDTNENGCGNGMWGGEWLGYLLLFALIGGGGFGFGGFGGGGILPWLLFGNGGFGGAGATNGYVLTSDFANIERKLDGINNGICDSTFALNNTINGNFRTLDNAICNIGYQALQNTNAIQTQLADCCCGIKGEIKDVAYGNERNSWNISKQISDCCCDLEKMNMQNRFDAQAYNCNTLQAIDKLGDRIIDYMSTEKLQALRDENQALRLQASQERQNAFITANQEAQTAELIRRLGRDCPVPAYVVPNPNCCYQPVSFNTCGCNGTF